MQPIHPNASEDEEPVQFKIKEDTDEQSGASTSSSTIKIEYLCTGARRKPTVKPEIAEISTQWDTADLPVVESEKKKKDNKPEETPKNSKKKAKAGTAQDPPSNPDITQENTEEKKKTKEKQAK